MRDMVPSRTTQDMPLDAPCLPSSARSQRSGAPFDLCPGEPIKGTPYLIEAPMACGGMGEIYEATHMMLGRRVVLKVLHERYARREDLARRLFEEARLLASIRHDNLVDVIDLGILPGDGRPYFVMEHLSGHDLRVELSRTGALPAPLAVDIVLQILEGLGQLHARGVIHRDIKPENVFLCHDGTVKVLDLGVAKVLGDDARVTHPGTSLGTPRAMAPEQCQGRAVDARTDLYAVGLVLYEIVAGRGPFDEIKDLDALSYAHCVRRPPRPSRFAPLPIPAAIESVILRALAKSPSARFPSAEAMARALESAIASTARSTLPEFVDMRPTLLLRSPFTQEDPTPGPVVSTAVIPTFSRWGLEPSRGALPAAMLALVVATLALGITLGKLVPQGGSAREPPEAAQAR
jgi:serine/threonine protein kinase